MSKSSYSFYLSKWEKHQSEIHQIRNSVFVQELGLQQNKIVHESDPDCYHVLAYDGEGKVIGTGCIAPNGEIGQIAVLKPWRGRTVGKAILIYLLHIAKTLHLPSVWVQSLETNTRFYQAKDFQLTDQAESIDGFNYRKMVHVLESKKVLH